MWKNEEETSFNGKKGYHLKKFQDMLIGEKCIFHTMIQTVEILISRVLGKLRLRTM